jgi:hypothetical protein
VIPPIGPPPFYLEEKMEKQNLAAAEEFEAALAIEYKNVVLAAEPWVHEHAKRRRKLLRMIYEAKPWLWPLVLIDVFLGAELVRHVGPGHAPQRRHEWEQKDFH